MSTRDITEYVAVDLDDERWRCRRCDGDLGDARRGYKRGCLVRERDPHEINRPFSDHEEYNFAQHPEWVRIVEFFCPDCGTMVEVEYLPPGHPITEDVVLDIDAMKADAKRA